MAGKLNMPAFANESESHASLTFSTALVFIQQGHRVQRAGWNGKGMWVQLQTPYENSKMTHPYIYIEYPSGHPAYPNGSRVPWAPSQTDILASDWSVLDAE